MVNLYFLAANWLDFLVAIIQYFKNIIFLTFRLQGDAERKRKRRHKFRETLNELCEENPIIAERLKSFTREETGRPSLEKDQPGILAAIVQIVQATSTADERRRTECLRTITTLDDLTEALRKLGFKLSRSATYLRCVLTRNFECFKLGFRIVHWGGFNLEK